MIERVKCADGKMRKAKRIICIHCKKESLQRITGRSVGKFCSKECGRLYKISQRHTLICSWCNKSFERPHSKLKNSRSGLAFCDRKCKESAQKLGGIQAIQPSHYGTRKEPINAGYRFQFDEEQLYCRRCGYKEFIGSVDIHHIDENHFNNNKENLIPLCANCHRGLHHNKWKIEEIMGHVAT